MDKGLFLLLTGLPGAGKTTIANSMADIFRQIKGPVVHLDGDILRTSLCSDLGFSKEDRQENLRRVFCLGDLLASQGVLVFASFIAPYKNTRNNMRSSLYFREIYVKCSQKECERRDPKEMYRKARQGKIKAYTGIDKSYEPPESPHFVLDTEHKTLEECRNELFIYILEEIYGKKMV